MIIQALPPHVVLILDMYDEIGEQVILHHSFFGLILVAEGKPLNLIDFDDSFDLLGVLGHHDHPCLTHKQLHLCPVEVLVHEHDLV